MKFVCSLLSKNNKEEANIDITDYSLWKKNIEYKISGNNEIIKYLIFNYSLAYNVYCFNFLMSTPERTAVGIECPWDLFAHSTLIEKEMNYDIKSKLFTKSLENSIEMKLGYDPILAHPWGEERMSDCFLSIGEENNKFKMTSNFRGILILPFYICLVTGGNHTTMTGIFKKDGIVEINDYCDYTNILDDIDFDGEYLYLIKNPNRKTKIRNKHLGRIFSLGKYLKENSMNKISF